VSGPNIINTTDASFDHDVLKSDRPVRGLGFCHNSLTVMAQPLP
jgi:hypothetical protein